MGKICIQTGKNDGKRIALESVRFHLNFSSVFLYNTLRDRKSESMTGGFTAGWISPIEPEKDMLNIICRKGCSFAGNSEERLFCICCSETNRNRCIVCAVFAGIIKQDIS